MDKNQPKSSPILNNNIGLCFWNKSRPQPQPRWRLQSDDSSCVVCLHVHKIRDFLPSMNGQSVTVEWKSKGCKREKTLPAQVCQGSANFDEIFLHYCTLQEVQSVLKAIVVSVSLIMDDDIEEEEMMIDSNLGIFKIDLSEVVMGDDLMNPKATGGKIASYDVQGIACGGILSIGVYCRMLEKATPTSSSSCFSDRRQPKMKCLSCLPNFKSLKVKPQSEPVLKMTPIPSEPEFRQYTHEDEDEEGFITMEKGIVRRPPSDDLRNTDDDEEEEKEEDEKSCLVINEVDKVEDEFLRMLETKNCKAKMVDRKGKGVEVSYWSSSYMDLDTLIKEAEVELNRETEAWKRRVRGGGAMLEEQEYKELIKRWGSSSSCFYGVYGAFGSPF